MLLSRHVKMRVHLNPDKFKEHALHEIRNIIEQHVCEYFDQPIEKIRLKSRRRIYVTPRQLIMFLLEYYTDWSQKQIGSYYGGRDHTTVLHSRQTMEDFLTQIASTPEKQQINAFLYRYGYKVIEAPVAEPQRVFIIDAHY